MLEYTGEIKSISVDWESGKPIVTLSINETEDFKAHHYEVCGKQIAIKMGEIKKKRSLDANAYCWVLLSQLSGKFNTSKEELYEIMLDRYGTLYKTDEGYVTITIPVKVDVRDLPGHWKAYKRSSDGKFISYLMIKGSSEYDTKEMSTFIDGIISECREYGIQTMTPNEIREMKERWHV